MSPAVKPGPRTSVLSTLNWRFSPVAKMALPSDPRLDQIKEDAQTDKRRQADDLLTRTQSDQGQHATDADDGRSSEEAEVQRRARQRYASASKPPRRCATGDVECGNGQCREHNQLGEGSGERQSDGNCGIAQNCHVGSVAAGVELPEDARQQAIPRERK